MINKKDIDKLLTLTRKWHNESDPEKAAVFCDQAKALSEKIAEGTPFQRNDPVAGNVFFSSAWYVAEKRWTNRQMYILLDRNGVNNAGEWIGDSL